MDMITLSPEHASAARAQFFDYFSARLQTATRDDVPLPDRMVVLGAALDVLAGHWHATADRATIPANLSGGERMRLFLLHHGGHPAFEKVSAPLFRNETGREIGTSFPFERYRPNEMNEVADWRDDPRFDDLQGAADVRALTRWSYGGVLYKDFRCAWVHKFALDNNGIRMTERDHFGRDEPYYRFVGNIGYFLLIMPVAFLASTLDRAIRSFDRECAARGVFPFTDE